MPYVPQEVRERFRQLGAVRYSCSSHIERDYWTGLPKVVEHDSIVHFWDAQGREIGFWNDVCKVVQVFAPNYREWSQGNLSVQLYFEMTEPA
jgi:hypothetical protein